MSSPVKLSATAKKSGGSAAAASAASAPPVAIAMVDDEAEEASEPEQDEAGEEEEEGEQGRRGGESPTESIDTDAMEWVRTLRLQSANDASPAETRKLESFMNAFDDLAVPLQVLENLIRDPDNIPAIILPGRQLISQKTTSEKGVGERERAFQRSFSKVQGHLLTLWHQITALKKDLTACMEKKAKFNDTKVLHHALQRQAQQREEEKLREQEEEIRRTLESPNLVKQARLRMKLTAVSQERRRGDVNEPVIGAWDRALNAASPQRQQLRIESASSVSQGGASPIQPRLLEFHPSPSRSQAAVAASASSPAPPQNRQNKKQRTEGSVAAAGSDSIVPLIPYRSAPASSAAAAADAAQPVAGNSSSQSGVSVEHPAAAAADAAAGSAVKEGSVGVDTGASVAATSIKPSTIRKRKHISIEDDGEDDDLPLSMFNPATGAVVAAAVTPAAAATAAPSTGAAPAAEKVTSADDANVD